VWFRLPVHRGKTIGRADRRSRFIVGTGPIVYIAPMVSRAHRIILADHARLPWRFFGRLAVCAQAAL